MNKTRNPLDDLARVRSKSLQQTSFKVIMDGEAAGAAETLAKELDNASKYLARVSSTSLEEDARARVVALTEELETANDALQAATVSFTIGAVPAPELDRLLRTCPATEEQQAEADAQARMAGEPRLRLRFNPDKFPPVLFRASLVSPELTEEDVMTMWFGPLIDPDDPDSERDPRGSRWSASELAGIHAACLALNGLG